MKHQAILIIILLASGACAQDKPKLIGEIEFFGYSGINLDNGAIDLNKVKTALPFHERTNSQRHFRSWLRKPQQPSNG